MRPYDKILSKITPTFFKTLQYQGYFEKNYYTLIASFDGYTKTPEVYHLYIPPKYFYYYYKFKKRYFHIFYENTSFDNMVSLTEQRAKDRYDVVSHVELIINIILNNFYIENKKLAAPYLISAEGIKKVFISLVGKDMYDTIRQNIK